MSEFIDFIYQPQSKEITFYVSAFAVILFVSAGAYIAFLDPVKFAKKYRKDY